LAGQAYHFTSDFAMDELARRAGREGAAQPLPGYQPWLDRLLSFDPKPVLFAHDGSVWQS
jgi:hypothetical protein